MEMIWRQQPLGLLVIDCRHPLARAQILIMEKVYQPSCVGSQAEILSGSAFMCCVLGLNIKWINLHV